MSVSHSPSDIIRTLLIANGLGNYPSISNLWPIYADFMPADIPSAVCVYNSLAHEEGRLMDGTVVEHPGIQIRIRNQDEPGLWLQSVLVRGVLDGCYFSSVPMIDGTYEGIQCINRYTNIMSLGEERRLKDIYTQGELQDLRYINVINAHITFANGDNMPVNYNGYITINNDVVATTPGVPVAVPAGGTGFVLAQANLLAKRAVGLATVAINPGLSGFIQTSGKVQLADWTAIVGSPTLAPHTLYFLEPASPGKLTTTPPVTIGQIVQEIGESVATDTLLLNIREPILL